MQRWDDDYHRDDKDEMIKIIRMQRWDDEYHWDDKNHPDAEMG
jgi:hypothetical protein